MRTDGTQTNTVLLNAAEQREARGFHLNINKEQLRFSATGFEWDEFFPRTVRRFLDTKWHFKTWTHVGLQWNSKVQELKIFFNCSEADYVSGGVSFDRTAHVFAPPQRLIVGANNELTNSGEVEIDELGIWDGILMREEICHVFHARRGKMKHNFFYSIRDLVAKLLGSVAELKKKFNLPQDNVNFAILRLQNISITSFKIAFSFLFRTDWY